MNYKYNRGSSKMLHVPCNQVLSFMPPCCFLNSLKMSQIAESFRFLHCWDGGIAHILSSLILRRLKLHGIKRQKVPKIQGLKKHQKNHSLACKKSSRF